MLTDLCPPANCPGERQRQARLKVTEAGWEAARPFWALSPALVSRMSSWSFCWLDRSQSGLGTVNFWDFCACKKLWANGVSVTVTAGAGPSTPESCERDLSFADIFQHRHRGIAAVDADDATAWVRTGSAKVHSLHRSPRRKPF